MGKIAKIMSVIVLSVCMVISFCACGSPSPTDAADSFLNAVKTQDQETLSSVYDSESFNILDSMDEDGIASNETESEDNVFANEMKDKMLDFDYTLSDEKIDGDKATVQVKITTYEFGKAMTSIITKYFEKALPLAFSGAPDEELEKIMNDIFKAELDTLTEKKYTGEATINLVQKDGEWKVSEIDAEGELMNVLTGDLVNAIKDIDESFEDME